MMTIYYTIESPRNRDYWRYPQFKHTVKPQDAKTKLPNHRCCSSFSPAHLPTVYKERIKGHKFRNIKTLFQIIEEIDVYNTIPLCVSLT